MKQGVVRPGAADRGAADLLVPADGVRERGKPALGKFALAGVIRGGAGGSVGPFSEHAVHPFLTELLKKSAGL